MKVNRSFRSPNFDASKIEVEFVVLHYTAGSLQSTFEIFRNPENKTSSHLIISTSGEIYEVVKCWDGETQRAWHAGKSIFSDGTKVWETFNDFSIGIEIVNSNGNLVAYNDKQYESLAFIINHLKSKYPALQDPNRIIGHEQIAGFRGKVDPGWLFDWPWLFEKCYPDFTAPLREPALPVELKESSEKFLATLPQEEKARGLFWHALSSSMEKAVGLINKKIDNGE